MRQVSILVSGFLLLVACNNNSTSSADIQSKPDSASQGIMYAYTTREKPNWEMGDPKNVAFVLQALKKYETGNVEALKDDFADSVWFAADGIQLNTTKDSLINFLKKDWENTKSIKIQMEDWEAVHGKDNKEDWVSLWYKQIWTGKDGKVDSVANMDDIKIENGKIRAIDSKHRRFPEKK